MARPVLFGAMVDDNFRHLGKGVYVNLECNGLGVAAAHTVFERVF